VSWGRIAFQDGILISEQASWTSAEEKKQIRREPYIYRQDVDNLMVEEFIQEESRNP